MQLNNDLTRILGGGIHALLHVSLPVSLAVGECRKAKDVS